MCIFLPRSDCLCNFISQPSSKLHFSCIASFTSLYSVQVTDSCVRSKRGFPSIKPSVWSSVIQNENVNKKLINFINGDPVHVLEKRRFIKSKNYC